jgi:AcrR family transcriptional regulator
MTAGKQPRAPRPYDGSGRRARAAAARREVLAVAHDLFVANGYAATTIGAIATAAGVSQPTIYAAFGTKAGVLERCIDVALAGDMAEVPVADRPLARWVYDTEDPVELLGRYATMMGVLAKRAAAIYSVLVDAADSEPDLRQLVTGFERQRHRAAGMVIDAVVAHDALASGRRAADAQDAVWLLNDPTVYTKLIGQRGWSHARYVAWARDNLIKQLLEPPVPGSPPKPGANVLEG